MVMKLQHYSKNEELKRKEFFCWVLKDFAFGLEETSQI
jgi:hypothetical protein